MASNKTRKPNPKRVPGTYLNADLYDDWAKWCKKLGVIQQSYMSKIITFMMGLDESTRTLFLKKVNKEDRADLAKLILQRIANGRSGRKGKKGLSGSVAVKSVARAKAQTPGGLGTRRNNRKSKSSEAG